MKKLTLPEPARQLWLATRDILTTLESPSKPWIAHLGGGTVIAARLKHRQSTDIDIMIRNTEPKGRAPASRPRCSEAVLRC